MPDPTARDRLARQGGAGGLDTLVLPPFPNVPPPTNPKELPQWWNEKLYPQLQRWIEQANTLLQRVT